MSRDFKVNGIEFNISNVARSCNLTELPYKYDLNMFNDFKKYWVRLCGCNTLAEGKEKANYYMSSNDINYR